MESTARIGSFEGNTSRERWSKCNNCRSSIHRSWQCPDKPNVTNTCSNCGGISHVSRGREEEQAVRFPMLSHFLLQVILVLITLAVNIITLRPQIQRLDTRFTTRHSYGIKINKQKDQIIRKQRRIIVWSSASSLIRSLFLFSLSFNT
jgi:hypothetical protein